MSGNIDFWHNDLFTRINHPLQGNNLFGANRLLRDAPFAATGVIKTGGQKN